LRRQVAAWLAEHAESDHTPGQVARALGGRSSGAVGNALAKLAESGHARRTSAKPQRYQATDTTNEAARAPEPGTATTRRAPRHPKPEPAAAPSAPSPPLPASAAAPPDTDESVSGPVIRPNGQAYHPRRLADLPDVAALRKLRAAGIPALLYGPPGTGKTSLIEAAFPDLITVAGDGDTTVADFVGEYTQTPDGTYEFVYGPLVVAMREGRPLLIDDATLISPKVLAVVYPAMDGRRQITVKAHKGETVTAQPGFYVVAGHNPGVHGAVLTEALASRFAAQIQVSTDYDLATALHIESRVVRVARHLAEKVAAGEIGWAPQLRELLAFTRISEVLGRDAAVSNLAGIAPEEDRDVVTAALRSVYGRPISPLALGRQI
jgi:MoxR-like ATPase